MNTPIDVLGWLDSLHTTTDAGALTNHKWPEAQEARAAVAELIREADLIADALTQDGRGPAGMTKEVAAKRLRAALARMGCAK